MIRFDKVSENREIVSAVKTLVGILKSFKQNTYLFGSATWRLPTDQFDESHDLDFLIDIENEKNIMDMTDGYLSCINEYLYKTVANFESIYVKNLDGKNNPITTKHVRLTLSKTFEIYLIFTSDIKTSLLNVNDIDNGLLFYNLSTERYEVAGLPTDITVQYLLDVCSSRKITTKYMKKYPHANTTFYRIIKMINYGFTYDIDEIYDIALSSLVTSQFFELDYPGRSCLPTEITKAKRMFYENCLNSQAYQFIKQCYSRKSMDLYISSDILFAITNYAIYMKDIDFAISLAEKLDILEPNSYFPMLIRKLDDFDITKKFLSCFSKYGIYGYYTLQTKYAKQLFSRDALKSNNKKYYEQLVDFDKDYKILE